MKTKTERILIIEDEEKLARMIELELSYEGYEVKKVYDGREGLNTALDEKADFDLILLDVMLPSLNGIDVLRRLRTRSDIPVILLTARNTTADKVSGLDLGADDYITKPFEIEELLARIRAALRKKMQNGNNVTGGLSCGPLSMDNEKRLAFVNNDSIDLTKREFDLLYYLLKNQGLVLSRDTLLNNVWDYDFSGETNAVDVYIRYLRAKIEEPYGIKLIHTVRGVGYVMKIE